MGVGRTEQGRKADNMAETEGYGFDGKMHIIQVQMGYPNRIAFSNKVILIAKNDSEEEHLSLKHPTNMRFLMMNTYDDT